MPDTISDLRKAFFGSTSEELDSLRAAIAEGKSFSDLIEIAGAGGTVSLPDGTAAAPSLTFDSDPDTGISRPGANQIQISGEVGIGVAPSAGRSLEMTKSITIREGGGAGFIQFVNSIHTAEFFRMSRDVANTEILVSVQGGGHSLVFQADGGGAKSVIVRGRAGQTGDLQQWQDDTRAVLASVTSDGKIRLPDGTAAAPALTFSSDTDTGIRGGTAELRVVVAGADKLMFFAGSVISQVPIRFQNGTAASPPISFQGDPDTGIYLSGTNALRISAGGSQRMAVTASVVQVNEDLQMLSALNHDGTTVGFYGTTPVAQQTGVAVSAAGIHAALVSLGLITA